MSTTPFHIGDLCEHTHAYQEKKKNFWWWEENVILLPLKKISTLDVINGLYK